MIYDFRMIFGKSVKVADSSTVVKTEQEQLQNQKTYSTSLELLKSSFERYCDQAYIEAFLRHFSNTFSTKFIFSRQACTVTNI